MGYRVLFLANPVKLSVKNEQLMIDNGEIARVPLVDLFAKRYIHEEGSAGVSSELRYHH